MAGRILAGLGALALAGSFACAAWAGGGCGPYAEIAQQLKDKYREEPIAEGLSQAGGKKLVIFAAPDGRTWTAVVVRAADAMGCLVAAGTDWSALAARGL